MPTTEVKIKVSAVDNTKGAFTTTERNLSGLEKTTQSLNNTVKSLAGAYIGAQGLSYALSQTIGNAIQFESKMAEVRKTTGFTAEQTKILGKEMIEMSKTLPVAAGDLADIAAVAGQLGIQGTENIKKFTEIVSKGVIALPEFAGGAEEIALVVAKAQNVFKFTVAESENLLSAMNELSNTTASNAKEIANFIENAGGAAAQMNITAVETAALGATFVSLGEDAYDAGTRTRAALISMMKNLEDAASVAGVSSAEFKRQLDENALVALENVVKGLEKIPSSTDRALTATGIFGQIGGKVIMKLAGNLDLLNTNLETSAKGWEQNISLQNEYNVASETTAKQIQLLKNNWDALTITLGEKLLPIVNKLITGLNELLNASNITSQLESSGRISQSTDDLIKLKDKQKAAGKDTTNIDKQIKQNMELQSKMSEEPSWTQTLGGWSKEWWKLTSNKLGFDDGGIVPGPRGKPTMALVHGGETILPTHKNESAGAVFNFNFSGAVIADKETFINEIKRSINREGQLSELGAT